MTAAVQMARRLTLPFGRGADTIMLRIDEQARVQAYDFTEHQARFGRAPEPRYLLALVQDLAKETLVEVDFEQPGTAPGTIAVTFPAGSSTGFSVVLDLPASAALRLTRLTMTPAPPDGRVDRFWRLTALLGTMAKLLWAIGVERDQLRGQFARTVAQRHLDTALGPSLDLIGADLGVPRFQPLPYGFDDGTIALYHLDEPGGSTVVTDVTGRYPGRSGHPGVLTGPVRPGAPGRYSSAFAFDTDKTAVQVASHPEFDIAANASATFECFVRPDAASTDGHVLSRHPAPGAAGAGWVLSIGEFDRGVERSPRLVVSDSVAPITLFADVSLPVDSFTHVAAVLDRTAKLLRLYVGGVLRASAPLGGLGAVAVTAPLRIGPNDSGFRGVVDEVRISSVARTGFAPALGEADEHYRRRLRVFRRWTLPTRANLEAMLNELAGPIGGSPGELVVEDRNAPLVRGTRLIRVRPVILRQGESIDASGDRRVSEVDAVGTAADEDRFDPAFLLTYQRAGVEFGGTGPCRVQVGLVEPLDRLVDLAVTESGAAGGLLIGAAFDPGAPDLRATGRAVLLGHAGIQPGRLAALAHRAGFDYVRFRPESRLGRARVYAAMAAGDYFAVDLAPAAGLVDVDVPGTGSLSLRPSPPAGSTVRWLTVPAGQGRGVVEPAVGAVVQLAATAPGELVVKAEVSFGGNTVAASRFVRIGVPSLADGQAIAADGTRGAPPSVASEFFRQRFLVRHNDSRVNYGGAENNRLMQPVLARSLDVLLAELTRRAVSGLLVVQTAFQPSGDEFASHGRKLVVSHPGVDAGVLAGLAHAAGFDHVTRSGSTVVIRQDPGELVVVQGGPVIELDEGAEVTLTVQPALTGGSDRLGWATGTLGTGRVVVVNPRLATTTVKGEVAGSAWVQASYLIGEAAPSLPAPHTFRVALRSGADLVISKDQYDLILNILHALHPVGVEVGTEAIREATVEVRDELAAINPDFTFPKFRVRKNLPPNRRGISRG